MGFTQLLIRMEYANDPLIYLYVFPEVIMDRLFIINVIPLKHNASVKN